MRPSSSSCSMTVDRGQLVPGGEDEVRLGVDDELHVDRGLDDDVGHVGDLGRIVVEVRHADQPVAGVEGADDFRVRRGEADDALGLGLDRDAAIGVVGQFDGERRLGRRAGGGRRRGRLGGIGRLGAFASGRAGSECQGEEESREATRGWGVSHVMSVPFTRGWRHRDSAGRPGSHASHRSDGTADTVAGLRRLLTGFAIYPSVFRRTAPTASSLIGAPILAGAPTVAGEAGSGRDSVLFPDVGVSRTGASRERHR